MCIQTSIRQGLWTTLCEPVPEGIPFVTLPPTDYEASLQPTTLQPIMDSQWNRGQVFSVWSAPLSLYVGYCLITYRFPSNKTYDLTSINRFFSEQPGLINFALVKMDPCTKLASKPYAWLRPSELSSRLQSTFSGSPHVQVVTACFSCNPPHFKSLKSNSL
jgi:hypothetical protein